jgi:8-oxo-dGTP diphosphatase
VSLFVVRHAKAGSRHDWPGDDLHRPLSKPGWRQAAAIAERLTHAGVTSLWTSPYVRCAQTLEPLGRALDLEIRADRRLAEGTTFEGALALVGEVGDGAVLCSHGDVIPDLLHALVRRGTRVLTPPDWRKGALWILDTPDSDGSIATARAEPPPAS